MATTITLTTNAASTDYTLTTGARGPAGGNGAAGSNGTNGSDATVTTANVATALGIPSYASLALANTALPIGALFINTGENPDQLQITTA